ncbi:gustatory receptor [Homalodisca vitripennis]|nr:gustatory receptor [Homalodisca vitripennis]
MKSFPDKLIRFCRIVGGLPLESTSGTRGIKVLTFSFTGFLWGSILFILQELFSSIALFTYFMDRPDGQTLHPLTKSTDVTIILNIVFLQVTVAVIFFSYVRKYPRLVDVFDTLECVYRNLLHKPSEVKATVKFCGFCFVVAISVTICKRMAHTIHGGVTVGRFLLSNKQFLFVLVLHCSKATFFVHFTHVATSISNCFRTVNDRIMKEINSNITDTIEINRSLPNVDYTHKTRSVLSTNNELKSLMNTYWTLCDAVHQANVFYGDQLMAVIFSSFIHVTIRSYCFFLYFRNGNMFAATSESIWILSHVCYLVLLVNSSTNLTNSANETSTMICKLINKNLDPAINEQLERFLLQLPHHNAKFSALGYFPVHNETLTAMAGAATTYLVILIQFQAQELPN